jgi:hypothetical protein
MILKGSYPFSFDDSMHGQLPCQEKSKQVPELSNSAGKAGTSLWEHPYFLGKSQPNLGNPNGLQEGDC